MPAGRPPKLDQVVDRTADGEPITAAEKVIQITRTLWAPWDVCAKAAGISPTTLDNWRRDGGLARGKIARGEAVTANQRRFAAFLTDLEKAEGEAVAARLAIIERAGEGGWVRRKTVTKTNAAGEVLETVTTEETAAPEWTAAAWTLERRRKQEYARHLEVTGAGGQPLVPKADRAAALAEALEAYQRGVDDGAAREAERGSRRKGAKADG